MNLSSRKMFAIILIIILFLVGCAKINDDDKVPTKPNENQSELADNDKEEGANGDDPYCENNNGDNGGFGTEDDEDEAVFLVEESKIINGWKQLTLRDYAYSTQDWDSYSFRENSPMISYKLHFPSNWNIEYSVFFDETGQKVAELLPPIIMSDGQKLLDNWQENPECELVSKEEIKVWDMSGVRIVIEAYPYGGDIEKWYPHTYYLTDGKRVFAMNFYAIEPSEEKQDLFDEIIKTFEFTG